MYTTGTKNALFGNCNKNLAATVRTIIFLINLLLPIFPIFLRLIHNIILPTSPLDHTSFCLSIKRTFTLHLLL